MIGFERAAFDGAAQVVRQRRAHAHSEHAGLFERMVDHAGDIARRKNIRVGDRLQRVLHFDEALAVQGQASLAQPGRATGAGDPHDLVDIEGAAVCRGEPPRRNLRHCRAAMHLHATLRQGTCKRAAHPCIVGRQNVRAAIEQMKFKFIRIAAQRAQFIAQAKLHR